MPIYNPPAGGSSGPATQIDADGTILDINAIADGNYLKRVGAAVVGDIPAGGSDPAQGSYAPGSFTLATEKYAIMSNRLQLTGVQRATLVGTARLRIT